MCCPDLAFPGRNFIMGWQILILLGANVMCCLQRDFQQAVANVSPVILCV